MGMAVRVPVKRERRRTLGSVFLLRNLSLSSRTHRQMARMVRRMWMMGLGMMRFGRCGRVEQAKGGSRSKSRG